MALRGWPFRIRVSQDGYGGHNVSCYDENGALLTRVFRIVMERHSSVVHVTMSKYDPDELAIDHPGEPHEQGVVVETRKYPIYRLDLEAGDRPIKEAEETSRS